LMAHEDFGGIVELAALQAAALFLDIAELFEGFLELAGEARAMQAERGEGAMSVDDVEGDCGLVGGRVGGAGKRSASRNGMRLRRQEVLASSWTSWVSVAVAGWYSSRNCWM